MTLPPLSGAAAQATAAQATADLEEARRIVAELRVLADAATEAEALREQLEAAEEELRRLRPVAARVEAAEADARGLAAELLASTRRQAETAREAMASRTITAHLGEQV